MTDLLLVGDDKLGRKLTARLGNNTSVVVAMDRSSSLKRVIKLVFFGKIPLGVFLKMAWAEWLREDYPRIVAPIVRSNTMLLRLIRECRARKVYLFRAGSIINKTILAEDVEILNVHCARLPEYGGLCSIARALKDGAFAQCATLHRVTARIDAGEVLETRAYQLDPGLSYAANEERAYEAGIELLLDFLSKRYQRESVSCEHPVDSTKYGCVK